MDLKAHIREIPDHPKPGILFYDIGSLFAHGAAWSETVRQLNEQAVAFKPDIIIGIESRGFPAAAVLGTVMQTGFVMARKKGKLPGDVVSHSYDLEYGKDTIEIQTGLIKPAQRVLVVDDLLATGGTAEAASTLARKMGGNVVGALFIIELVGLGGRAKLEKMNVPVANLLSYNA